MKRKRITLISFALILSIVMVACGNKANPSASDNGNSDLQEVQKTVVKLGHQAPPGTAYDIFATTFKEYVEERTNGQYEIEIYSGGQLGGGRELMEGLQVGNIEFAVLTASDMGNFVPEMEVQDLPYLFNSWDEINKFLVSDVAREFYALSDEVGMTTLAFMPRGFRHTTNNKGEIVVPDDMKGLKIRVAESSLYIDTFKAMGANPQSMAWGEVFTALQQGTVDGHENTAITIKDYKIDEVQKYVSETGHMFAFAAIATNPDFFVGLGEDMQEIIRQSAIDAGKDAGKIQQQAEAEAKAELESKGMQFNEVDKQKFIDLMEPVYEKFFKNHERKYFDAIKDAVK